MTFPRELSASELVAVLKSAGFQLINVHRACLWLERGDLLVGVPCTGSLSWDAVVRIAKEAKLSDAELASLSSRKVEHAA